MSDNSAVARYESVVALEKESEKILTNFELQLKHAIKERDEFKDRLKAEYGVNSVEELKKLYQTKKEKFNSVVANLDTTVNNLYNIVNQNSELGDENLHKFLQNLNEVIKAEKSQTSSGAVEV